MLRGQGKKSSLQFFLFRKYAYPSLYYNNWMCCHNLDDVFAVILWEVSLQYAKQFNNIFGLLFASQNWCMTKNIYCCKDKKDFLIKAHKYHLNRFNVTFFLLLLCSCSINATYLKRNERWNIILVKRWMIHLTRQFNVR